MLLEPGTLPARPDPERYMRAAAALETARNPAGARVAYLAAVQLWPKAPLPRIGLGNLSAATGDWVAAERWYSAVLADDPSQAAALNNRAEALVQLGCPDAARIALRAGMDHVAADDPLQPELQQDVAKSIGHDVVAPCQRCRTVHEVHGPLMPDAEFVDRPD